MRKRLAAALMTTAVGGAFAASASASLVVYEPFDYTSGQAIAGQTNTYSPGNPVWAGAGTAGSSVHQVASGNLTGPITPSVGNSASMLGTDNKELDRLALAGAPYSANSTLYYSLLLQIPDLTGLTTAHTNLNANNGFLVGFNNATGTGSLPSNWGGELVIRLGSAANTYNLGIRASGTPGGTNTGHTYWSGDVTADSTTHFVVVRYKQDGDSTDTGGSGDENALWLDPSSANFGVAEGSVPSPDGSSTGSINKASVGVNNYAASIMIGASQTLNGMAPNSYGLDEIRVGTTWLDVTTVPEPASLSLLGLGAIGLLSRRRRK